MAAAQVRGFAIIRSVTKMVGDLIALGIQPSEIEQMRWTKMRYYSAWYKEPI